MDRSMAAPKRDSKSTHHEEAEDLTDSVEALKDLCCLIEFIDLEVRPVVNSYREKNPPEDSILRHVASISSQEIYFTVL